MNHPVLSSFISSVREGLPDILLGPARLYESLRARHNPGQGASPR